MEKSNMFGEREGNIKLNLKDLIKEDKYKRMKAEEELFHKLEIKHYCIDEDYGDLDECGVEFTTSSGETFTVSVDMEEVFFVDGSASSQELEERMYDYPVDRLSNIVCDLVIEAFATRDIEVSLY